MVFQVRNVFYPPGTRNPKVLSFPPAPPSHRLHASSIQVELWRLVFVIASRPDVTSRVRARARVCIYVCPRGCRLAVSWESRSARPWSRYTPLHCGSCLRSERVHLVSSTRLYIDTQVHDCESRLVALLEISCDEEQRIYKIMKLSIFLFCINILF